MVRHPGLRGQHLDRPSGDIGSVGDHEVDTAPQDGGQRFEEIAFVHLACGGDVATGAPHRSRMDVDGVQLDLLDGLDQGDAHCARAAAQIDEDGSRPGDGGGSSDEELGAVARYEYSRVHGNPQTTELCPAEDVFERQADDSPFHPWPRGRSASLLPR